MMLGNIRFKLTLWYIVILGIILTSFSTFLYLTLSRSLYKGIDVKIKSIAEVIGSSSTNPYSQYSFSNIDRMLEDSFSVKPVTKFIQVLDESGRIGRKSDNLQDFQLPISFRTLKNASQGKITFETIKALGEYPLRMVTVPVIQGRNVVNIVQVATSLEEVEEALNTLLLILWITVPSALVFASLGGLFLANKAHDKILNRPISTPPPPMRAETRKFLHGFFRNELHGLDELIGIDAAKIWFEHSGTIGDA